MNDRVPDGWLISAYVAAPPVWDRGEHARYYDAIAELDGVAGFEIPFSGSLHPHDEAWFLRRVTARHAYTITTIPDTMHQLAHDPMFGLASVDAAGRAAAIARTARTAAAVRRCNDAAGARVVRAVTLYSAPRSREKRSDGARFAESLAAVTEFDWDGARVVIEHCDAPVADRRVVKGFLPLEDEVSAVGAARERTGIDLGIQLNWGRSVVEGRTHTTAADHIATVRAAGLLAGFTLSGCAPVDTSHGPAWDDCHVPPDPLCPVSELTSARIAATLAALGAARIMRGIKVSAPTGADLATRIDTVARTLSVVQAAERRAAGR
ncbi:DUF4862 family protein [Nocardia sp. NPDC058705]|uniref:DUF4862 family protein n=1 Tax=Nocardia sp. NPDC058705 TaxID=3346609 RepID=UPI0036853150